MRMLVTTWNALDETVRLILVVGAMCLTGLWMHHAEREQRSQRQMHATAAGTRADSCGHASVQARRAVAELRALGEISGDEAQRIARRIENNDRTCRTSG